MGGVDQAAIKELDHHHATHVADGKIRRAVGHHHHVKSLSCLDGGPQYRPSLIQGQTVRLPPQIGDIRTPATSKSEPTATKIVAVGVANKKTGRIVRTMILAAITRSSPRRQ